ncbi:MAG TPA: nucleoside triphosphate pyrophosphatase [Pseudomonadales bacterium]
MKPLILASASPRRLQLLAQIGLAATVMAADIDETPQAAENDRDYVLRMAAGKARAIAMQRPDALVLAADTVISLDGRLIGKPRDRDDAFAIWRALSGRCHQVLSAVALLDDGRLQTAISCSEVQFAVLDATDMAAYWDSGEPQDKAGAYAIQGLAACWISEIRGSYSGIMGLPLFETAQLLGKAGVRIVS